MLTVSQRNQHKYQHLQRREKLEFRQRQSCLQPVRLQMEFGGKFYIEQPQLHDLEIDRLHYQTFERPIVNVLAFVTRALTTCNVPNRTTDA